MVTTHSSKASRTPTISRPILIGATSYRQIPAKATAGVSVDVSKAYDSRFLTYRAYSVFRSFSSRDFKSEKKADVKSFEEYGMDLFLKDRGLWGTVSNVHGFEANIVREFYSNIHKELVSDPSSTMFGKVYVRGNTYDFSPASINKFTGLERVDSIADDEVEGKMIVELTGGKLKNQTSTLPASLLTWKYAVLHNIAVFNWMPTENTTTLTLEQASFLYRVGKFLAFDFGSLVFQYVVRASSKPSASSILPFPNLIYAMLKDQGYEPRVKTVIITEEKTRLVITKSLLSDDRVKDLPYKPPHNFEEEEPLHLVIDIDKHAEEDVDVAPLDVSTDVATEVIPTLDSISATAVRDEIQRVHSLITQVEAIAKELHAVHKTLKSFLPLTQQGDRDPAVGF